MREITIAVAIAVLAAAGATAAFASDHGEHEEHGERRGRGERERRGRQAPAPADAEARALYRKECGACHLDFPPGFLPAGSHRRILAGLGRHFGQDAELEPEVRSRIERWLVANAAEDGTSRRSRRTPASIEGEPPLRLTEVPYFRRKHREIGPRVVARPSVRTLANCAACHPGAGDWDFDDDRAKIPAG